MSVTDLRSHISQLIQERQIHTVRVVLHDPSNIQRARYVPVRYFLEQVIQGSLSYPSALFSMDTSASLVPDAGDGFAGGYPSWVMKPDLATFGIIPSSPGMAHVIADIYLPNGQPVPTAPRHVLRRVLADISEAGYRVYGAFEYEFYVFRTDGSHTGMQGLEPIWNGLQCFSEVKQAEVEDIITSVMFALTDMGAGPEVANTEYGSGQFEVTNSPFWGLEIADMAFYYRTLIREVLQHKGYKVSFMAKPVTNMSGSGAHTHHSLFDHKGNNLFSDPEQPDGLSQLCRWFIGGQIQHARALSALCNPTVNSYKRLKPYSFAPTTVTWGYEHRGAIIRIPQHRGENTRLENRLPGADTNPYITLAAMLAAGMDGIRRQIKPPPPLLNQDAYASDFLGLPRSLPQALAALEEDTFFWETLGQDYLRHFISMRRKEWERYEAAVTDWEYKEYFDLY
ncbi:glutamate--isopropylamine ligase [Peptococcaceae bacterium CEB3]|nr:glutamate--isopropylamine ligase [Peptococcaceae bacterium CEB3]